MMKEIILTAFVLAMLFAVPGLAQEVCFVYFTADCLNCYVADSHVESVKTSSNKVVVIKYNVDDPSVNMNVLNAYKDTYQVDFNRPLVLFGMYDALRGMDDIRVGLQERVDYLLTQEGNVCPLVDGTFTDPATIDDVSLPGEPEILVIVTPKEPDANVTDNRTGEESPEEQEPQEAPLYPEPLKFIEDVEEYVKEPENFFTLMIVVFVIIFAAVGFIMYKFRG